jgi:hypothetical protein
MSTMGTDRSWLLRCMMRYASCSLVPVRRMRIPLARSISLRASSACRAASASRRASASARERAAAMRSVASSVTGGAGLASSATAALSSISAGLSCSDRSPVISTTAVPGSSRAMAAAAAAPLAPGRC